MKRNLWLSILAIISILIISLLISPLTTSALNDQQQNQGNGNPQKPWDSWHNIEIPNSKTWCSPGKTNEFEIKGKTSYRGYNVCEVTVSFPGGTTTQYTTEDGLYQYTIMRDSNGNTVDEGETINEHRR